ncbi:copper resistance protein CopC [Sphingopyxis yananensis]|uniref:copper resistance protein CopC n=1 Tax=Sphingopyxis yananensis TaxID=2886687 RepID=UPI001D10B8F7|nr:copper resistance protein CopC [Sphingopyxis yananensis]MCC2603469.1 copper resistance protein CopC [Sphingopyxis yananensis]
MSRTFAAITASLLLLGVTSAADARLAVSSARPAANSTASKVTSLSLQFNETITPSSLRTELIMTAMPGMTDHPPMKMRATSAIGRDSKSVTMTLKRPLVPGTYRVSWTATATGAQPSSGQYSFSVR